MIIGTNNTINQDKQLVDFTPDNTTSLFSSQQDLERLNFENTIDLSDIVVKAMPITDTTNTQQTTTTTTQLNTINLADIESATASMLKANGKINTVSYANLTPVNMNSGYRNELQFDDNSNSQYYDDDNEDENDDDDDEEYQVKPGNKRPTRTRGAINAKRYSTASTSSSTQMSAPIVKSTKGRKPKSETNVGAKITGEPDVARFGNKYVKKGTQEYEVRRNRNNEAVKKCREKSQVVQAEREQRLQQLSEENRKLSNTVDSLNKELSVLKNILLQMNPQNRLPNELEEKINRLESMILSNNTISTAKS